MLGNGQVVIILELHELLAQQPADQVVLPSASPPPTESVGRPDYFVHAPETGDRAPETPQGPWTASTDARQRPPTYRETPAPSAPISSLPPADTVMQSGTPTSATLGTPFVVSNYLPTPSSPHRVAVGPAARRPYVLVVDDSPSVRRVVSNMLKANGWEVQSARDGVEALDMIARQVPSAVLLDIEMPRMDGYELMATVRSQEQYRRLPLIVLTSRAATKHHQRAFQLGADAYLVKPYQDEELLSTLARLVNEP